MTRSCFLRCFRSHEARPSGIGILASDKICPVLARWYPDAEIFGIGNIRDKAEQELGSRFDLHLPAGSLPLVLDRMDASYQHYLSTVKSQMS